jgi:hypothetical protein
MTPAISVAGLSRRYRGTLAAVIPSALTLAAAGPERTW